MSTARDPVSMEEHASVTIREGNMQSRIMSVRGLAVALLSVALLAGPSAHANAAAEPRNVSLRGRVVAQADSTPLAGVQVSVLRVDERGSSAKQVVWRTRNKSDGTYTLRVPAGSGLVQRFIDLTHRFERTEKGPFVVAAYHSYRVDRALARPGEITGIVRDEDGTPIRRASIWAYYPVPRDERSPYEAMTDFNGRYHLYAPKGAYLLRFARTRAGGTTYAAEWFGDVAHRVDTPNVQIGSTGRRTGVDATLR